MAGRLKDTPYPALSSSLKSANLRKCLNLNHNKSKIMLKAIPLDSLNKEMAIHPDHGKENFYNML